jgi:hypothetical protein
MKSCIRLIETLLATSLIFCIGCSEKPKNTQTIALSATTPPRSQFIPPADSVISVERMQKWLVCNPLLDSLSYLYQDSFKIDNAGLRLRYQDDFTKAQDKICIRCGLAGGYAEYRWIMQNAGRPANRPVLDSVGLKTY